MPHASEVWVNPLGGAVVAGPGGERLYYAGLLEKLKVNARVYKVGEYKSAVEPYSNTGMSEPARENARALYETLWEEYRANLKKARPGADIERVTTRPVGWGAAARGDLVDRGAAETGRREDFQRGIEDGLAIDFLDSRKRLGLFRRPCFCARHGFLLSLPWRGRFVRW